MIWNYRGYGRTKTKRSCCCLFGPGNDTSPQKIEEDARILLDYMRRIMGLKGKFGVYGRSLGGIATTHLADKVDMIIVDRSFANFYDVVERKFFGTPALCLFRAVTKKWRTYNDFNFVNKGLPRNGHGSVSSLHPSRQFSYEHDQLEDIREGDSPDTLGARAFTFGRSSSMRPCYKVVTCDIKDEIVELQSSLMVGIARVVAQKHQKNTQHYSHQPIGILT